MALIALLLCLQDPDIDRIDHEASRIPRFVAARMPGPASDGEFLRRLSLDLTGAPPTAAESRAFLDDAAPSKRREAIDRLEALARLVTASAQFDRGMANRIWAWMMGRGVVDPPDGFNRRNKPSSRALLAALEDVFREKGRSIRAFLRTVALTKAYQRSSEGEVPMAQRVVPLSPQQLVHALQTATMGAPRRDPEETRRLAGGCTVLARVQGCEVVAQPCGTLQALFLRNSEELWGWIVDGPVLRAVRASEDPIEALFVAVLSRRPGADERDRFARFLDGTADAWQDAMWILLNSVEFLTRG